MSNQEENIYNAWLRAEQAESMAKHLAAANAPAINWLVRVKNKTWWLSMVPAVLLLVQAVAAPFGYQWDFVVLNQQLAAIINAAFTFLVLLGVVNDPTTDGIKDSVQAMGYDEPKKTRG